MSTLDATLVVARLVVGLWLFWSVPTLVRPRRTSTEPPTPSDLAEVSVVVPARDEAASLPMLLDSLPSGPEVIVVDDGSTDGTAEVAAERGALVVAPAEPPEGWTGKTWACAHGARVASRDVLAFVDADVRFAEGGLEAAVHRHVRASGAETGGLTSVQPFHEPGSATERLASIFNVVGFAGTDASTPLGRMRGTRGAFGPVLVTARSDYEAVGGHERVRASIVEDIELARAYRRTARPVTIVGGGQLVSFRMYPDGFGQLVEGFTKNIAAGVGGVRLATTTLLIAWMTLLVQAAVAPVRAAFTGAGLVVPVLLYVAVAAQYWWMARRVGRFGPVVAAAFPLATGLFLLVFARSLLAAVRGSVSWRGRRVSTRRHR